MVPLTKEEERIRRRRTLLTIGPACFIAIIYIVVASLYGNSFHSALHNQEPWNLTTDRGETFFLTIDPQINSINGDWASSGFSLHLNGLSDIQVVPPHGRDWNYALLTSNIADHERVTINGSFTLPNSIAGPEHRTLDGAISGDISYPKAVGAQSFEDADISIQIPVHIEIVLPGEVPWMIDKLALYALALLGILVFVFTPRMLLIYDQRMQNLWGFLDPLLPAPEYRQQVRNMAALVGVLYGGGLLLALLLLTGSAPASLFDDIFAPAAAMIVVALGTIIVTAIVKKWRFARSSAI